MAARSRLCDEPLKIRINRFFVCLLRSIVGHGRHHCDLGIFRGFCRRRFLPHGLITANSGARQLGQSAVTCRNQDDTLATTSR